MVDEGPGDHEVLVDSQLNRDVLSETLDAQLERYLALLVLAGVRVQGQGSLLPFDGDGLEEVEGPAQEVVSLPEVSKKAGRGRREGGRKGGRRGGREGREGGR